MYDSDNKLKVKNDEVFMKILSSDINLNSSYEKIFFNYEKLDLKIINSKTTKNSNNNFNINLLELKFEKLDINSSSMDENELKTFIIKFFIEKLTGKEIKTLSLKDLNEIINVDTDIEQPQFAAEINYERFKYEKENVNFKAEGKIITKDGTEIKFSIGFNLSKEMIDYTRINIKAGSVALVDPLIINFDGNLNDLLSDTKFSFDLNSDGKEEIISTLNEGNGFLVFDKNGNKKIDNGSELFGVKTGDGFKELKKYDSDNNNWIDENDSIFNKLNVWIKTKNQDKLFSLKDLNVGAIYLKNSFTPFDFENGKLDKSSIFLKENGDVGIISKIDFKI